MKTLSQIYSSYLESDNHFANKISKSNKRARERLEKLRDRNEHAFFVLLFARLDDYIKTQCEKIEFQKSKITHWKRKRPWDSIELKYFKFNNRLALVTQKGGTDFNKINKYYSIRNALAHGDFNSIAPLNLPSVFSDFSNFIKNTSI